MKYNFWQLEPRTKANDSRQWRVDLSNFGPSFTHFTAIHHCAYESIDLSSSISIARLFHSLCCNVHHHAFIRVQLSCCCFFFIPMHHPHRPLVLLYLIETTVCMLDAFRCFRHLLLRSLCCISSLSCGSFTHSNALRYPCQPLLL